jgi:hypothetical protein
VIAVVVLVGVSVGIVLLGVIVGKAASSPEAPVSVAGSKGVDMPTNDSACTPPAPDVMAVGSWECASCGTRLSVRGTTTMQSACCGVTVEIIPGVGR